MPINSDNGEPRAPGLTSGGGGSWVTIYCIARMPGEEPAMVRCLFLHTSDRLKGMITNRARMNE